MVSAINTHIGVEDVVKFGYSAIANLSDKNADNQARISACGESEAVLSTVNTT